MAILSTLRTRVGPGLIIMALLIGLVTPGMASARHAAHPGEALTTAGTCSLPLTHDTYDGFHIGVPAGWSLSTLGDTIAVTKNVAATEMAVVYPVLNTNGVTPGTLFTTYFAALAKTATASHNTLSYQLVNKPGQLPRAIVTGRAGTVAVRGLATISIMPFRTRLAASLLVFSAYWAPTSRLAADTAMLASIGGCYGPEPGTLYQVYNDQAFYFALPLDWRVADEGQDNIDLVGDSGRAVVSYLLTLMSTSESGTTPRSLLTAIFNQIHIQVSRILSSTDLPSQPGADGSTVGEEYMEFLGQYQGHAIHGFVIIVNSTGSLDTSGVMRLAVATTGRWNADNGGLLKVMTSVRHSLTLDEQQWQHLQQQWQQFSEGEQKFDDIINGVDEVRDPSTGTVYAAPYDTYNQSGPDGPGYYIDNGGTLEKLQPVQN